MKTTVKAGIHLFYWIFASLLVFAIVKVSFHSGIRDDQFLKFILEGIFLSAAGFYTGYLYLFPRYLAKQQARKAVARGLLVSAGTALFVALIQLNVFPIAFNYGFSLHLLTGVLFTTLLFTLFTGLHVVAGCFVNGFITWYSDIRYKEALEKKNYKRSSTC